MMIRSLRLLCGVVLLWTASICSAEPPFIAGYDRFAPHEEISPETAGRLLLTELSCTACHPTERKDLQPKRGPDLNGVGTRTGFNWLQRYLGDSHKVKPGSTMPDLLSGLEGDEKERTILSLTAFLSTLTQTYPEVKGSGAKPVPFQFWLKGNPERGEKLYHTIGCVACHEPDPNYETAERKPTPLEQTLEQLDPEEIEELGLARMARPVKSVPHGDLSGKYTAQSLTFFLLDPTKSRPAGRMPDFHLTPVEAADIASYVISRHPADNTESSSKPNNELVEQGRTLFVEIGCVNCHSVKGLKPRRTAKGLTALNFAAARRCTGGDQQDLPQYHLDERQQEALNSAAASLSESTNDSTLDFTLLQLNCYGCHERDKRGGVGRNRKAYFETVRHIDLGDEGRIPPPLTGVGRKLTQSWIKKVLDGTATVRPYLTARMPKFPPKSVDSLPTEFARVDELEKQSANVPHAASVRKTEQQVFGNLNGLAEVGRQLFDTGCVKCHPIHGEALPGVVGVDLHDATDRIHPEWFKKFLFNPGEIKPRTRMPTFFPNGVSSNKEILGGDVDQQIASLWAYLKQADKLPLPQQVLTFRAQNFELIPKDKLIILRTFMKAAGTHAVAVGFPEKVHFAYDAEQVRLAQIWKGRFLDAQSTWFERFATPAEPLGDQIVTLPAGPSLRLTEPDGKSAQEADIEFRGYRLDRSGVPVFLSRLGPVEIEEKIAAKGENALERTWMIARNERPDSHLGLRLKLLDAGEITSSEKNVWTNGKGLSIVVSPEFEPQSSNGVLSVPIDLPEPGKATTIKVKYQW